MTDSNTNSTISTSKLDPRLLVFLRLNTGENILCKLIDENEDSVRFTNPVLSLSYADPRSGLVSFGLYPWAPHPRLMFLEYNMKKDHIVAISQFDSTLLPGYETIVQTMFERSKLNDEYDDYAPEDGNPEELPPIKPKRRKLVN